MPRYELNLPDGLTLDMLDDYARAKQNAQRRANYAAHPETYHAQRIRSNVNFLRKNGFLVVPMDELPPKPWTAETLLSVFKSAMEGADSE